MQVIRRDEPTGAPTLLFRVHVDRGISWDMTQGFLRQALAAPASAAALASASAAGAEPGAEGQAGASPAASSGDQSRPKQKLKIRLGGKFVTADCARSSDATMTAAEGYSCSVPLPDAAEGSAPPVAPGSASHMHTSTAQDLLQLQEMESQSQLDSVSAGATAEAGQRHSSTAPGTSLDAMPQITYLVQRTDTATLDQPLMNASVSQHGSSSAHPSLASDQTVHGQSDPFSLHNSLGSGSAVGALLADAAKAEPKSGLASASEPSDPSAISGYYRPERGAVRGVLLALETQGKGQVAVFRPATGPAARPMRLAELQEK